jgi:hypothetical protein
MLTKALPATQSEVIVRQRKKNVDIPTVLADRERGMGVHHIPVA